MGPQVGSRVRVLARAMFAALMCAAIGAMPAGAARNCNVVAAGFALPQVRGGCYYLRAPPGHPVLLAFLQTVPDTADTPSRLQLTSLLSLSRQYRARGLDVVVVDESSLVGQQPPDRNALVNASFDWHLDIPSLDDQANRVARHFGITQLPTMLLLAPDGTVFRHWRGVTHAAKLAQGAQALLGGPLGGLPEL